MDSEADAGDYLARLQAGRDPSAEITDRVRYEKTVEQALAAVWERLDDGDRLAWATMACLAPGPVTVGLLDACGVDADRRRRLREAFVLQGEGAGRWGLHRLVRDFGESRAGEEARAEAFVGGISRFAETDPATGHVAYLPDAGHFDHLLARMPVASLGGAEAWLHLAAHVATARHSAGDLTRARALYQKALAMAETTPDITETWREGFRSKSYLAVTLHDLGDLPAARSEAREAVRIALLQPAGSRVREGVHHALAPLLPTDD